MTTLTVITPPLMVTTIMRMPARMALATTPVEQRANDIAAWRAMRGITHLCVNTMGLGLPGPEAHVRILERFKKDASDR